MARRAYAWPPIINTIAREVVDVARMNGVHGRLRIQKTKDSDAIV